VRKKRSKEGHESSKSGKLSETSLERGGEPRFYLLVVFRNSLDNEIGGRACVRIKSRKKNEGA